MERQPVLIRLTRSSYAGLVANSHVQAAAMPLWTIETVDRNEKVPITGRAGGFGSIVIHIAKAVHKVHDYLVSV